MKGYGGKFGVGDMNGAGNRLDYYEELNKKGGPKMI